MSCACSDKEQQGIEEKWKKKPAGDYGHKVSKFRCIADALSSVVIAGFCRRCDLSQPSPPKSEGLFAAYGVRTQ